MAISFKTIPWKRIALFISWTLVFIAFVTLWVMAFQAQKNTTTQAITIQIDQAYNKYFISKSDINKIIKQNGYDTLYHKKANQIRFQQLENSMEENPWIDQASIYTNRNGTVAIHVQQRCPLMRIINKNNVGFYIDKNGTIMQLSSKFTARVLIVTGAVSSSDFNSSNVTSSKRYDLIQLVEWISKDAFWNAQITEIKVRENGEMSLYPLIGDSEIDFGKAADFESKFNKLKLFYTEGLSLMGWNKYRKITIKYDRQIVCEKK
jgi:cell division protein FtsQ